MLEIGGFFGLELEDGNEYHKTKYKLNNARNAVKYILENKKYKKIYMPNYTCDSIKDKIKDLDIEIVEYNISGNLEPKLNLSMIKENECILYVNYFGVCNNQVKLLSERCKQLSVHLIIDNTQAFFMRPGKEEYTVYSARKFFGVPDGSYLYSKTKLGEIDGLNERVWGKDGLYLIQRIEENATAAYSSFKEASIMHRNLNVEKMSKLSKKILKSIDYNNIISKRNQNFLILHNEFGKINKLNLDIDVINGAMIYPLWITNGNLLRKNLIQNKIYIAKYWEDVLKKKNTSQREWDMVENIIAIPIDQRYGKDEMEYIIKLIRDNLKSEC